MGANLDEDTQRLILTVTSITTCFLLSAILYGEFFLIPKLVRSFSIKDPPPRIALPCLVWICRVGILTGLLTLPIVSFNVTKRPIEKDLSSSINFCEEDYLHTHFIAEPANTVSSLTVYVPLGLLGLFCCGTCRRFQIAYLALIAIGIGSAGLHSILSAEAQGGDELPMLWFCAAASFIALDILRERYFPDRPFSLWLVFVIVCTAIAATTTYVANRQDFYIFYIILSIYGWTLILSTFWIVLGLKYDDETFHARVLLPLASASAKSFLAAVWVWVLEMLYCSAALQDDSHVWIRFVWNRVLHPLWHVFSGLLAWLLLQELFAAYGTQQGWCIATIQCYGVPYVSLIPKPKVD